MKTEEALCDLTAFQHALAEHVSWLQHWYQAVLYQGKIPNPAAQACKFSAWHSGAAGRVIGGSTDFEPLRLAHELVHSMASQFTERVAEGHAVTTSDFETLMTASLEFGSIAQSLEREVWKTLATLDPLTGLSNRQLMINQLVRERDRAIRQRMPACVALADIDHFKKINDRYGHPFGDKVLREVGALLNGMVRPYDTIYRYGGEEFLFCLPGTTVEEASAILDRVRNAVAEMVITAQNDVDIRVAITIGVTALNNDFSVEDSIEQADRALYSGKRAGRNRVVRYAPT